MPQNDTTGQLQGNDVYEDSYGKHIQVKWVNNGKKEKKQWQSPVLFFDCLSERRLATNNDS